MRLDVNVRPDKEATELCSHATVTLDGRPVAQCVIADEEAGVIVRHGPFDRSVGEWPIITEHGNVEIRFRANSPDWIKAKYSERVLSV